MSPNIEDTDNTRIAITRAEFVMLVVLVTLGVGAWAWVDLQVSSYTKDWEPREERAQIAHNLDRLEAALNMAREERNQTGEQLIKARLELYHQEATLAAAPTQPTPTPASAQPTPAPTRTTGAASTSSAGNESSTAVTAVTRDASARHAEKLKERQGLLQQEIDRLTSQVEDARRGVAHDFGREQFWYRLERPAVTLFAATLLTALLTAVLLLVWRLTRSSDAGAVLRPQAQALAWLLCGLLCVLYAYQAFAVVGAAFVGAIVLTIYLARAPWEARRADRAGGQGA